MWFLAFRLLPSAYEACQGGEAARRQHYNNGAAADSPGQQGCGLSASWALGFRLSMIIVPFVISACMVYHSPLNMPGSISVDCQTDELIVYVAVVFPTKAVCSAETMRAVETSILKATGNAL